MLRKVNRIITFCALGLLALAGIMLAVSRNPENWVAIYQAEVLANFSFFLLLASIVSELLLLQEDK